jgi:hypothetical protein
MARNKNVFIGAAGTLLRILSIIMEAIRDNDGLDEDFSLVEKDATLADAIGKLVAEAGKKARKIFHLLVNYDRSVEEGIRAGHYDWSNSNITSSNFPSTRKGTAEEDVHLVHFDKVMSTDAVLAELDKMGLRPAELQHSLAFGEKYPEVQRKFPVVFLGSVWQDPYGTRYCPFLFRFDAERRLYLVWIVVDWHGGCRFAAVRK